MKGLTESITYGINIELGKIILHMKAQDERIAELEAQIAANADAAVDPITPLRNLTAWQELRADVLHGLDGLDNDQTNIVLGAIDYYMPDADSTALQAPVREVPRWQPIETAPKDGTHILLWWGEQARLGWWLDNSHTRTPWAGWKVPSLQVVPFGCQPTHWMPLPAAPVQQEGE